MSQRCTRSKKCYVCGGNNVRGNYHMTNACTKLTRTKLSRKLSQLLSKNFLMVVSKDDVICKCCASMLNTLDKLEKDVSEIKNILVSALSKRYNLPEDELKEGGVHDVFMTSGNTSREVKGQSASTSIAGHEDDDEWITCDTCQFEMTERQLDARKEQAAKIDRGAENIAKDSKSPADERPESEADTPAPCKPKVDQAETSSTPGTSFGEATAAGVELMKGSEVPPSVLTPELTPEQSMTDTPKDDLQVSLELLDTENGPAVFLVSQDGAILNKVQQTEDGIPFVTLNDNEVRVLKFNGDDTVELLPASFATSSNRPGSNN